MEPFDVEPHTRVVFGEGSFEKLGGLSSELCFRRTLLVADRGMVGCGYVARAIKLLSSADIEAFPFHDFDENPDSEMIAAGLAYAGPLGIDSLIGLGGGSSMDCAKGINFLLTNGGTIGEYQGYGRALRPLLPMIGIPTTAGTGSEAQSYALISDAGTHMKMACGDPTAAFRLAILDPLLTLTLPPGITAITGYDAIAHAVETFVTTKRTPLSEMYSREAWRLLEGSYEMVLSNPADPGARSAMLLGANLAGAAIENSMLGATHACANPLTAHYGISHGEAIAVMLPHIVRWNDSVASMRYHELLRISGRVIEDDNPGVELARRLEQLARAGGLPGRLSELGIPEADLQMLSTEASAQWTGAFNPRPWSAAGALEVYKWAF